MPMIFLQPYYLAAAISNIVGNLYTTATADPYYDNVVLHMHMDGAQNSTVFTDRKGATITRNGGPFITTTTSKIGGASGAFNGISDYLTTPSSSVYALNKKDFTVECWIYPTNINKGTQSIIDFRINGQGGGQTKPHLIAGAGQVLFQIGSTNMAGTTIVNNTWYHLAWSRKDGTSYCFVNGALVGSFADTNDYGGPNDVIIGQVGDARTYDGYYAGLIDEVRITSGYGRYTQAFTPATAAFPDSSPGSSYDAFFDNVSLLMHFEGADNSTNFIDVKGATFTKGGTPYISANTGTSKIGTGSGAFTNNSYIRSPVSTAYGFGKNDFTIEFWINPSNVSGGNQGVFDMRAEGAGASQAKPTIFIDTGNIYFQANGANLGSMALSNSTWYHIAWSRKSGVSYFLVNGVVIGQFYDSIDYGTSSDITLGKVSNNHGYQYYFTGNIDELRVTKGIGRYTTNFTPMTTAFANYNMVPDPYYNKVTTLLHMDGSNGTNVFTDSKGTASFTLTGAPKLTTANSKFGATSLQVAASDIVTIAASDALYLPGDYTIEMWIYTTALPTSGVSQLMEKINRGTYPSYGIEMFTDGAIRAYFGNGINGSTAGLSYMTAPPITLNKWTHLVQQRRGGLSEFYVDGVVISSGPSGQVDQAPTTNVLLAQNFTGFIDEIRVTKDYARYTGAFTPPTVPGGDLQA